MDYRIGKRSGVIGDSVGIPPQNENHPIKFGPKNYYVPLPR